MCRSRMVRECDSSDRPNTAVLKLIGVRSNPTLAAKTTTRPGWAPRFSGCQRQCNQVCDRLKKFHWVRAFPGLKIETGGTHRWYKIMRPQTERQCNCRYLTPRYKPEAHVVGYPMAIFVAERRREQGAGFVDNRCLQFLGEFIEYTATKCT